MKSGSPAVAWREVNEGGVWVVPAFGIDQQTSRWTEGYARRSTDGFSNPANKQNLLALWLLALHDATGKSACRTRAEKWWSVNLVRNFPSEHPLLHPSHRQQIIE